MEKIFANGLSFKRPNEKAPEFVKGSLSVKTDEFIDFLKANSVNGWVNLDLKESQKGTLYFELNTWQPSKDKFVKKEDGSLGVIDIPEDEDEEINVKGLPF